MFRGVVFYLLPAGAILLNSRFVLILIGTERFSVDEGPIGRNPGDNNEVGRSIHISVGVNVTRMPELLPTKYVPRIKIN